MAERDYRNGERGPEQKRDGDPGWVTEYVREQEGGREGGRGEEEPVENVF